MIKRWVHSRWGVIALLWCVVHITVLGAGILFYADFEPDMVREWSDAVTYYETAQSFEQRQPLYEVDFWDDNMTYHYHPFFALLLSIFGGLSFRLFTFLLLVSQVIAYCANLWVWYRVLQALQLDAYIVAYRIWWLVALVSTTWFANLVYGNIASTLLLLSGLLTYAIIQRKPAWVVGLGLLILIAKPHWLFPLLLIVLFREWRLLAYSFAGLFAGYILLNGAYVGLVGLDYGTTTLTQYGQFLLSGGQNFHWVAGTGDFANFNHSWNQIFLSYFGDQAWVSLANIAVRGVMVALVLGVVLLAWQRRATLHTHGAMVLWGWGVGYLVAMAMLPQLWDLVGGIMLFIFIQALPQENIRYFSRLYLIYVLFEIPAIFGFLLGWDWLLLPESIPLTMVALIFLLGFNLFAIGHILQVKQEENLNHGYATSY